MEKLNALSQSSLLTFEHKKQLHYRPINNVYEEKVSFHKSKQKFCRWTKEEVIKYNILIFRTIYSLI